MPLQDFTTGDFRETKQNLIDFFSSQDEFQDFDFTGRRLSVLMDLLAYGDTFAQQFSSAVYREGWIQTATQRGNIVLHAQQKYFYEPRSTKASRVSLDCVFLDEQERSSITIPRGTVFEGTNSRGTWPFLVLEDTTVLRDSQGEYRVTLQLTQGDIFTRQRSIGEDRDVVIRDPAMDRDTLEVEISGETWSKQTNSARVAPGEPVFYTREDRLGNTVIYFGTGESFEGEVISGFGGRQPDTGETIVFSYVNTDAENANGCRDFELASGPDGDIDLDSVELVDGQGSIGGDEPETRSSIVFNAPRWRRADGRCVSPSDYDAHVQRVFGNIVETNQTWTDPDNIGFAFISAKSFDSFGTSTEVKSDIEEYLEDLNVSTIRPVVIDPSRILIRHQVQIDYEPGRSTESQLEVSVINSIDDYYTNSVSIFNGSFHNSRLLSAIDSSDDSILGSSSANSLLIEYRDSALESIVRLTFGNSIISGSLESTEFTFRSDEYTDASETERVKYDVSMSSSGDDLLIGPFKSLEQSITATVYETTDEGDWYKIGDIDPDRGRFNYSFFDLGTPRNRFPTATIEFEADTNETDIYAPQGTLILYDNALRPDLTEIEFNPRT